MTPSLYIINNIKTIKIKKKPIKVHQKSSKKIRNKTGFFFFWGGGGGGGVANFLERDKEGLII